MGCGTRFAVSDFACLQTVVVVAAAAADDDDYDVVVVVVVDEEEEQDGDDDDTMMMMMMMMMMMCFVVDTGHYIILLMMKSQFLDALHFRRELTRMIYISNSKPSSNEFCLFRDNRTIQRRFQSLESQL